MVNDNVFENATSPTRAGKLVMLDEIANAILFLGIPNAGRIHGHVLTIDNSHTLLVPK